MSKETPICGNALDPGRLQQSAIGDKAFMRPEKAWRMRPLPCIDDPSDGKYKVALTSWSSSSEAYPQEYVCERTERCLSVTWLRKSSSATFWCEHRIAFKGPVYPSQLLLVGPELHCRVLVHEPCSVFRLYIPSELFKECRYLMDGSGELDDFQFAEARFIRDPFIEKLTQAMSMAGVHHDSSCAMYVDSIGLAIAGRLIVRAGKNEPPAWKRAKGALCSWRLNRVKEYVESRIGEAIQLSDLAQAAGLSRMHFASQFQVATGLTPHRYVQLRRIAKAQELLLRNDAPIVDVAMMVGFQTQAHFTVVFKSIIGATPDRWRKEMG